MGNSESPSSNSYASIKLQCDANVCIVEQDFKGKVVVGVIRAYPVKSLVVMLKGIEGIKLPNDQQSRVIIDDCIPLDLPCIGGVVQPGTYSLPFCFKISSSCPNSFTKEKIEDIIGIIEYQCIAKLDSNIEGQLENARIVKVSRGPIC